MDERAQGETTPPGVCQVYDMDVSILVVKNSLAPVEKGVAVYDLF